VPVPREVLRNLASESQLRSAVRLRVASPSAPNDAVQQRTKNREIARSVESLIGLVRNFVSEIEGGRVDAAMATVSPQYHDPGGRDATRLKTDLEQLVKSLPDLKIIPFKAEDLQLVGNSITATLHAAWRTIKKDASGKEKHEAASTKIELIFEKDHHGAWKIGSLHVL
jgi:hypothetical protein